MNIKIVSSVVLALGIVILVVLVVLGAVVRQTISDTIIDRLIYELPKGAKDNSDYEACYRDTVATFENEYYLWNLTNSADFLNGTKPHFDLVGPFSYAQWYCRYDYHLNETSGYLTYRTRYEGYFFLRDDSVSEDNVLITNINPAYLGVLKQTSDSALPYVFVPHILNATIQTLALPSTVTAVKQSGFPGVLAEMNSDIKKSLIAQNAVGVVGQFPIAYFFDNTSTVINGVQGWASYVYSINSTLNSTIDPSFQQPIYDSLTNAAALNAFSLRSGADLSAQFNLTAQLGQLLSNYVSYLFNTTLFVESSTSALYNQWANGTTVSAPYPASWGLGVASGISYDDVETLFDTTNPCSLTSDTGIQQWSLISGGNASLEALCPGSFTLSVAQVQAISTWMASYATAVVEPTLLSDYGITTWDDLAYAQWGLRVAGKSVRDMPGFNATAFALILSGITQIPSAFLLATTVNNNRLTFEPEVSIPITYTFQNVDQIKGLFVNKETSLFNTTHFLVFLNLMNRLPPNTPALSALYGDRVGETTGAFVVLRYINPVLLPAIASPMLQFIYKAGGGYVTTRTAREWLFTAQDPLLPFLGQKAGVGLVNNVTRTKEEANTLNKTYVPVFTGKNDLLWSLMPYNNGTNLTFWNGTVLITGYNGTQFLPNGYVDKKDKEYPLDLFHPLINRTIPFTNKAKLKWNGVNIRYLAVADDALLSADKNPVNYVYYSQYSGAINKSSNPPYLPVFLTTPNFLSAEAAFSANVTFNDTIFTDYKPDPLSQHRLTQFILVEPLLGSTLWANLPIQVNFEYKPSANFPTINGGFAPIYWNAIGDKASPENLETIKSSLYRGQRTWPALIGVGAAVGSVMIIAGIVGLIYYRKQKGIKL